MQKLLFPLIFSLFGIFFNCANQQPPGGGEEDKTPPVVMSSIPANNTVNFRDNVIILEFDEYIDRRSFVDALRISPPITGGFETDWNGTEVTIEFTNAPYRENPDKTYIITLNSTLKDIRGNSISSPYVLAFSTGSEIDKASVAGSVFNNKGKIINIFAYNIINSESEYDPVNKVADYLTETDASGKYKLTNIAPGKYRLIAVEDGDRNLLYTPDFENFGVLDRDIDIFDSLQVNKVNFNLKSLSVVTAEIDLNKFNPDSLGIVYSSVKENSEILPEQSILFYFRNYKFDRDEFSKSLTITDNNNNRLKPVINWRNDTIVEVFAAENFQYARSYSIKFDMDLAQDAAYNYAFDFKTISENAFGDIKGSIRLDTAAVTFPDVVITLESKLTETAGAQEYRVTVKDTVFEIKKILQGEYNLFAFIDNNRNGVYDYGQVYPFEYSEPFFFYTTQIRIRSGWTVENVVIDFTR